MTLTPVPNLIAGEWLVDSTATQTTPVYNPSRGEIIAQTPLCSAATVDAAVQAASAAFPAWADTPAHRARPRLLPLQNAA